MTPTAAKRSEQDSMLVPMDSHKSKALNNKCWNVRVSNQSPTKKSAKISLEEPSAGGLAKKHDNSGQLERMSHRLRMPEGNDIERPPSPTFLRDEGPMNGLSLVIDPTLVHGMTEMPPAHTGEPPHQLPAEAIRDNDASEMAAQMDQTRARKELQRYCFIGITGILLLALAAGIAFAMILLLQK